MESKAPFNSQLSLRVRSIKEGEEWSSVFLREAHPVSPDLGIKPALANVSRTAKTCGSNCLWDRRTTFCLHEEGNAIVGGQGEWGGVEGQTVSILAPSLRRQ